MMGIRSFLFFVIIPAALFFSCQPERSYTEDPVARLEFTLDTLFFDTVFTTVGTVTRAFRVKNPNRQFIRIDEIRLAGGAFSVFRINVDGAPGLRFTDLEIAPRDSMYVFVEATLDPNGSDDILRIQDSIVFETNGKVQDIDLVAWGQDVHMIAGETIAQSTTWPAGKPYLIIDYLYVDSLASLTIDPGVRVYLHKDASIFVDGSLQVNGSLEEPVWFGGDRLEEFYKHIPGQWGLIYLSGSSHNNRIIHTEIHNGTIGVLISATPESGLLPDLEISGSVINRMSSSGLYALNAVVRGSNLVVGDCGGSCVALNYGGDYHFTHCTLANFWPSGFSRRSMPALFLSDYFGTYNEEGELLLYTGGEFENAIFLNSIIYGSHATELLIESYDGLQLNYLMDYCLTSIHEDSLRYLEDPLITNLIFNENPLFDSIPVVYELDSLSPAIDAGLPAHASGFPLDLKGSSRLDDEAPDLGALERTGL
ncbi:MAG: hypothetical protein P1P86_05450 [Bacteroidales bacterium]|nr:hypothetical protein [Bacteroidales bacterium]